ncbi:hypothetical protein BLS_002405 [Venturia inaequalis]|nr:hypothetical protein BLS_002405 [Venturia inaequalis]KAE9976452.1 hypothetical protein EG328_002634 [Venturia inaequalis]
MGKTIEDLPNELLTAIFHRVHASSHSCLISCIGCCQLWKALAEPILWRHIFLKFENAKRFSAHVVALSKSKEGRRKLETVRCLRIAIPGNGRDYAGCVRDESVCEEEASGGLRIWNELDMDTEVDQLRVFIRRTYADSLMKVGIYALQDAVPLLSSLKTFHLLVYNGVKMNGPEDMLGTIGYRAKTDGPDPDMFVGLIDRLPSTVRDLCLDLSDATR